MGWKGKFFGALIGLLLTRSLYGAVIGAIIGHLFDQGGALGFVPAAPNAASGSISDVFFRATFEVMGHVAKADGRVSEAEIGAARALMQQLRLGPREVSIAIECFRHGKSASYDAEVGVERLREACSQRYDLLRAFMEVQLRAALAGDGISRASRTVLTRIGERLGMSAQELATLEAALRARNTRSGAGAGPRGAAFATLTLAQAYSELEVDAGSTNQEVTKAYRRQMSRHHPDKLVANGLPESMMEVAKEKTQRIQEAYEMIRVSRGM